MNCRVNDCRREKTTELSSGRSVCSYCPAWRGETGDRELEARAVLKLPTKQDRLRWLQLYEKQHGAAARHRLEAVILKMWPSRELLIGELASKL